MIYTASNALGASVYDVDTKTEIRQVMSTDTEAGVVTCAEQPLRIEGGEIAQFTLQYRAIHAIKGLEPAPVLFHCYGLQ